MATKTFKIGLSNTDKQNMAQDVYERLLALTFPEYDTATQYEVGDFVVYNDQLYKCIGATSGAWDSTKWQLATLNDLLTDIENAVAFVNDKANVDGNYPTMTVGFADNLTPYDESAGDDQDEPFSFQATGTGNGTQPDFATGSGALMKEKQGNTVVVNQLLENNDFESTSTWNKVGSGDGSISVANNILTFTTTNGDTGIRQGGRNFIAGHKYLTMFMVKTNVNGAKLQGYSTIAQYNLTSEVDSVANTWQTLYGIATINETTSSSVYLYCNKNSEVQSITAEYKKPVFVDLTQWFNGDIPQDLLDHPENFFRYYQGSLAYNLGTLVNANGRYIKCIGMNQWDEEWEQGGYNATTGEKYSLAGAIRSKNYIKVIPNTDYYFKISGSAYCRICFYDKDKNFISCLNWDVANFNKVNKTPANACYLTFNTNDNYGTTYNNDISINLYYEDEPRCLTYEPYQVLTNNDTGTEVLRSAGSVKDSKAPDGTITRRIGVVDLGSLSWSKTSDENYFFNANLPDDCVKTITTNTKPNAINVKYVYSQIISSNTNLGFCFSTAQIRIRDTSYNDAATFKTAMSGVYLFYELAEETTEQGTPYSENLVIDDFGSMDFGSDVPQGALIFYPVDYKAFIDTLYDYTDGTPSNIALKSDLPTAPQSWAESLPGYDATKTQTLKNVEGTLTWVDDE